VKVPSSGNQPEREIGSRRIKLHPTPVMKLKPTTVKAQRTITLFRPEGVKP
jgi:hypothetical protein